jgi:EAL domain-containing protein (putative c-di-GMP-specific phosphodiesterase class I)
MSCAVCSVRENCASSALHLAAETGDMRELLEGTLNSLGIEFERRGEVYSISSRGDQPRVVGLLRQMLSGPERSAVKVCELRGESFPALRDLDQWWRMHETNWFEEALTENRFETWFQPIIDTTNREALGHECLIRLQTNRLYSGAEIVEAARVRNQIHAFDAHARRLAILSAARQNPHARYFVNFMPSSIYNPEFCMRGTMEALAETGMGRENVVFEVVESDLVRDSAHLRRICDYYRSHGFAFALDDVGTGSNSLQMVCELRPEYVKLDKSLVQNVEKPMYGATIRKLVELADRFSVRVIAEGVETIHTMENLWLLGVQYMQGYLFGRPERNVSGSEAGLLRLAHALAPQQAYDGELITTPVSISCRPGSTTQARKQESSDQSLARR